MASLCQLTAAAALHNRYKLQAPIKLAPPN